MTCGRNAAPQQGRAGCALIVLKIGPGPLEQGEVFIALLLGGRDPVPQRLQVSQDGRSRLVLRHRFGGRFAGREHGSRWISHGGFSLENDRSSCNPSGRPVAGPSRVP